MLQKQRSGRLGVGAKSRAFAEAFTGLSKSRRVCGREPKTLNPEPKGKPKGKLHAREASRCIAAARGTCREESCDEGFLLKLLWHPHATITKNQKSLIEPPFINLV